MANVRPPRSKAPTNDDRPAQQFAGMCPVARTASGFFLPTGPDPVETLIKQGRSRTQELLPIRYGRMRANPFAFLRGATAVMAADLAHTPSTNIRMQSCGDAHLNNFGTYATQDGVPVF